MAVSVIYSKSHLYSYLYLLHWISYNADDYNLMYYFSIIIALMIIALIIISSS